MLYTIVIKNDFMTNIRADFIEKIVFFAIFSFFSDIIIPIIADETKIEIELPNKYIVTSSHILGFFPRLKIAGSKLGKIKKKSEKNKLQGINSRIYFFPIFLYILNMG